MDASRNFRLRRVKPHHEAKNAPLPRIDEMFYRLQEAQIFSKLYLKTGLYKIQVLPQGVEKTSLSTKYGQFEYVIPMGLLIPLKNSRSS